MKTRQEAFKSEVKKYAFKHGLTYSQALSVLNDPRPEVYNWVDWDQQLTDLRIAEMTKKTPITQKSEF